MSQKKEWQQPRVIIFSHQFISSGTICVSAPESSNTHNGNFNPLNCFLTPSGGVKTFSGGFTYAKADANCTNNAFPCS